MSARFFSLIGLTLCLGLSLLHAKDEPVPKLEGKWTCSIDKVPSPKGVMKVQSTMVYRKNGTFEEVRLADPPPSKTIIKGRYSYAKGVLTQTVVEGTITNGIATTPIPKSWLGKHTAKIQWKNKDQYMVPQSDGRQLVWTRN